MRSNVVVHSAVLLLAAIALVLVFLGSEASASVIFHNDTTLSGTYENTTIASWGNITVPKGSTLELLNVTLVFLTDHGQRSLVGQEGCTIIITDTDGDPDTEVDSSNITSTRNSWSIKVEKGCEFYLSNSRMEGVTGLYQSPDGKVSTTTTVEADTIQLDGSQILLDSGFLRFVGASVQVTASRLVCPTIFDRGIVFIGHQLKLSDTSTDDTCLNIVGLLSNEVEDCTFTDSTVYPGASWTTTFWRCRFVSTPLSIYDPKAKTLSFIDCLFEGPVATAIQSYFPSLQIQGCTFEDVGYAVSAWTDTCNMTDCRIEALHGIMGTFNTLTVSNTSFDLAPMGTGIWAASGWGNVTLSNVSVANCFEGINITRQDGSVILTDCSLTNISGPGVTIEGSSFVLIERSTFLDLFSGICIETNGTVGPHTTVRDAVFECYTHALSITGGSLFVANATMVGNPGPGNYSLGIGLKSWTRDGRIPVIVTNTSVRNFRSGISLISDSYRAMEARLEGVTVLESDVAISITLLGALTLTNVSIDGFLQGILVSRCGDVHVDRVLMTNGIDGLLINLTQSVRMEQLSINNVTGSAIDQEHVEEALWPIDQETSLEDLRISVVANVIVTEDLTLRNVTLEVRETSYDDEGFAVNNGARLHLINSTIQGQVSTPCYMRVTDGATLLARDSAIVRCGGHHNDPSRTGLSLEGGSHELVETRIEDGMNGLVLQDAKVTLIGCHVSGNHSGITSTNSDLTLIDCVANASLIAIHMDSGRLRSENSSLDASPWLLDLDASLAWLGNSSLRTSGVLARMDGSTLDLVNTSIEPLHAQGGTLINSEVNLYDTHHEGNWTFRGVLGTVRTYWHLDIVAIHRWDRSPAVGATVTVFDALMPRVPHIAGTCGEDGSMPLEWMLERLLEVGQEIVHRPFVLVVEAEGVMARVEVPGNDSWSGVLQLVDVSPPSLTIQSPDPGVILNVTSVLVDGVILELGSGLLDLDISFDGGIWEPLEADSGRWSVLLDAYDGPHNLTVRALDRDGNLVSAETWFLIDTVPPLVSFTYPLPYAPLPHATVTLMGFVVLAEGSQITRCEVDGSTVHLSSNGTFEFVVSLLREGENVFTAEIWDEAGNRGEASLVLVRDTGPPIVVLEDHPPLTNSSRLLVNGSVVDVSNIEVSLDGRLVPIEEDGTFTIDVDLQLGRNRMILVIDDAVGNRVTEELDVVCDYLINGTIIRPIHGEVVKGPYVQVELSTDPGTWVRVEGHTDWTYTGLNDSIALYVEFEPGADQNLTVEFRDEADNLLVREVTITVREPTADRSGDGTLLWILVGGAIVAALAIGAWIRLR